MSAMHLLACLVTEREPRETAKIPLSEWNWIFPVAYHRLKMARPSPDDLLELNLNN